MILVGELINASRKAIKKIIEDKDEKAIAHIATAQKEAGADFIDVNAGVFVGEETERLKWLVNTVQTAVDGSCCIDPAQF